MSVNPKPIDDAIRRRTLLAEIGVEEEELTSGLHAGVARRAQCTANHPPMSPGYYMFSETVASLAEQLGKRGWTRRDYKNFSTVVRPDKRVAIAVASGDDGTGDLSADVTTRSPKGAATYEAVGMNYSLPLDHRYESDNKERAIKTQTWFLLHQVKDGQLIAELSLPKTIFDGYVHTWDPRIPLKPFALPGSIDLSGGEPPHSPEVVVRKKS